jgi:hypothetical protein
MLTRHRQGFPVSHPMSSLPLTCDPWTEQEPLGFTMSFEPSRYRLRTSRWGQVTDTDLKSLRRHQSTSNPRTRLLRATSCRRHYAYLPDRGVRSPGPLRPVSGSPGLLGRSRLLVGWAARRGPSEPGPFSGSLPPNPACPLSRHRALQRLRRVRDRAALAENVKYHYGFLHYASLMVASRSSPVPLRPVDRH